MNKYKVDYIAGSITVTKSFAKAASIWGSNEYNLLKQLRADNPSFTVLVREIEKKEGKRSYHNLNYENMRKFIAALEGENSAALNELSKIIEIATIQSAPYTYVKKWFLSRYKDVMDNVTDTSDLVVLAHIK